jgi:hypothetical protein
MVDHINISPAEAAIVTESALDSDGFAHLRRPYNGSRRELQSPGWDCHRRELHEHRAWVEAARVAKGPCSGGGALCAAR